eukprot:CAMPEP_0203757246 /NCGR_PEP_ID=MMETSP0098-20131031/10366_1 /ASSEMBLY_ACC=CAM_ASM_000208 /TAXON_ID=96639 /ORGANISM=" , Strain NY0313808BC1" /LENGTH=74 /DNA_ID=CAMNT_0050649415 /DNA_START=450 /DNA_END=674 /DNA_ORIENTATION=-
MNRESRLVCILPDKGGKCERVERRGAKVPHLARAELAHALVVKPVHLGDLSCFMIPPNEMDPPRVPDLERKEQE